MSRREFPARVMVDAFKRSGGNWHKALAAYNCGNAGLRGECGQGYASRVWRLVKKGGR